MTFPPTPTPTEAAHVLDYYGEDGGMRPGSFVGKLIAAMAAADPINLAMLAAVYPGLAQAVHLARDVEGGVLELRALAAANLAVGS